MRASFVLACLLIVMIMTQSGLAFGQSSLRGDLPGSGNGVNNITKAESPVSNSTDKAPLVAKANIPASGGDVESAGGTTCCKHGNDNTNCYIRYVSGHNGAVGPKDCKNNVAGAGCARHGFVPHCCPASDVGIAWVLGGCH